MNANYLFDIFEVTRINEVPDLFIGLAMLQHKDPIPEDMTDRGIREFIGAHYDALVDAYKAKDREVFAKAVEQCVKEDEARKEAE